MKKELFFLLIIIYNSIYAQENNSYTFGEVTQKELDTRVYEKDSSANAVYLFENGETFFIKEDGSILINTTYYAKIKVFNKNTFDNATVEIPIFHSEETTEKIINIRGITHHGNKTTLLTKENIFNEKLSKNWSLVKFTMPNIKDNSIIEYEYTFQTPYKSKFTGWTFQADIPKIYSRFHALIPSNYIYTRNLIGYLKLSKNTASLKRGCFGLSKHGDKADCEDLLYEIRDIPAFIEEEYMTSKDNYLSRIDFKISKFYDFYGSKHKLSQTWKEIDEEFKNVDEFGKQLQKTSYFKKHLPSYLFKIKTQAEKAIKTYSFIKNHFTKKTKKSSYTVNVKKAFKNKSGNPIEINFALINALNALDIRANYLLVSTRDNGLPSKLHPSINDFNYGVVRVIVEGLEYFLDASNNSYSFGMIPFSALNGYGRVMDFKNGSYWTTIKPINNNKTRFVLNLKINDVGDFEGILFKVFNGYGALERRKIIKHFSKEKYLRTLEKQESGLTINIYKNSNLDNVDKPLKEFFDITIENENEFGKHTFVINPFMITQFKRNPFRLKERTYPVDFGYPSTFTYTLSLEIPEKYRINSLPTNKAFKLPNNGGDYHFNIEKKKNTIKMSSKLILRKFFFPPSEYQSLKKFYSKIIKTQHSLITVSNIIK